MAPLAPARGHPLGSYPDLSLAEAREKADALSLRARTRSRRSVATEAMTRTFGALADRYLKEHARRFKKTAEADERALTVHILPKWGGPALPQYRPA
jgi:hypothetical protein